MTAMRVCSVSSKWSRSVCVGWVRLRGGGGVVLYSRCQHSVVLRTECAVSQFYSNTHCPLSTDSNWYGFYHWFARAGEQRVKRTPWLHRFYHLSRQRNPTEVNQHILLLKCATCSTNAHVRQYMNSTHRHILGYKDLTNGHTLIRHIDINIPTNTLIRQMDIYTKTLMWCHCLASRRNSDGHWSYSLSLLSDTERTWLKTCQITTDYNGIKGSRFPYTVRCTVLAAHRECLTFRQQERVFCCC